MGIQRLQHSEITDLTKYTPLFQVGGVNLASAGVETDVININGKGYFDRFTIRSGWATSGYVYTINFYIDGVKKHVIAFPSTSGSYAWRGIYLLDHQKTNGTTPYVQVFDGSVISFSQEVADYKGWGNLTGDSKNTLLLAPILFEQQLRITAQVSIGNDNMKFLFSGGIR